MTQDPVIPFSPWMIAAFSAIGLLVGLVAGMSLTPVVGALLPLLFATIGGGAGFFATSKPVYSRQIGIAVTLFALTCLCGSIYGIRLRQGLAWRCFFLNCLDESAQANLKLQIPASVNDQDSLVLLFSIKSNLLFLDLETRRRSAYSK